jgi:hypothetical protein
MVEAKAIPAEMEIDRIKAITTNLRDGENDDKEFERRLKIADRMLKDKEINLKQMNLHGGQSNGIPTRTQPNSGANQQQLQQAFEADNAARGAGGRINVG